MKKKQTSFLHALKTLAIHSVPVLLFASPAGVQGAPGDPNATALVAIASEVRGKQVAELLCGICHTFQKGEISAIGPNLWQIMERPTASAKLYPYSHALLKTLRERRQEYWTPDVLNSFLYSPSTFSPGTRMFISGLKDPFDRADVVRYLLSLGEKKPPLPVPAEQLQAARDLLASHTPAYDVLKKGLGQKATFYVCTACHSESIIKQQGLSQARWEEVIASMTEEQGMPTLRPGLRRLIVNYLAASYGPDSK